ncbi:MAG: ATP phosphoribosyltransferase regulatory subunit [Acidithiobacillus sp.]|nr:ATP phosphoribosyltransferase regulatory subunit [Acidithiobacillus sp.]
MIATEAGTWILPAGFDDMGPGQAAALEQKRRELLDLFASWGYQQLIPPMLEHLESLLTGSAADLDLETWKVIDQVSGRVLGFRSDMTPQMARMDAQMARRGEARRFCYAGTVLRARPDALGGSRAPFQVGAELFGVASPQGDLEIISLMLESVQRCLDSALHLDLGHVQIPMYLVQAARLSPAQTNQIIHAIERKAWPDLQRLLQEAGVSLDLRQQFLTLAGLRGDRRCLERARRIFTSQAELEPALDSLEYVWSVLEERFPAVRIRADLAELQGHHYHTGMLFAVYSSQRGAPVARGGRYDGIGEAYGCHRPATGFSLDLRPLLREWSAQKAQRPLVWAPADDSLALWQALQALRAQGYVVVQESNPDNHFPPAAFDAYLVLEDGHWRLSGSSPDLPFSPS